MNDAPKKWMVFWKNNERLASLEATDANKRQLESICRLELIQIDATTGTEHYEVHKLPEAKNERR